MTHVFDREVGRIPGVFEVLRGPLHLTARSGSLPGTARSCRGGITPTTAAGTAWLRHRRQLVRRRLSVSRLARGILTLIRRTARVSTGCLLLARLAGTGCRPLTLLTLTLLTLTLLTLTLLTLTLLT
ncbi:MAG: hypothetical protein ACKOTB_18065, partial [Planctomycetia bacterium]